jgi:hypothetical protein
VNNGGLDVIEDGTIDTDVDATADVLIASDDIAIAADPALLDTADVADPAMFEGGRPSDPMPNWRTLTSNETTDEQTTDAQGGSDGTDPATGGTDGDVPAEWAYTDFVPVFEKDPGTDGGEYADDTPPDVYTMGEDDPRIFQTFGPIGETPGRGSDPLPFERTNSDPVPAAHLVVEIDRTPVHFAAADSFNSGLDLL